MALILCARDRLSVTQDASMQAERCVHKWRFVTVTLNGS